MSSSCSAITTISTLIAPDTNTCAPNRPMIRRMRGLLPTAAKPSATSARMPSVCDSLIGRSPRGMPDSITSDQANVSESIAITVPVPAQTSNRPPRAGPRNVPTLSIVLVTTLAAVSCSGDDVSDGSSAVWAGWNAVETAVTISAAAYTITAGADVHTATAAPAVASRRIESEASITERRR